MGLWCGLDFVGELSLFEGLIQVPLFEKPFGIQEMNDWIIVSIFQQGLDGSGCVGIDVFRNVGTGL